MPHEFRHHMLTQLERDILEAFDAVPGTHLSIDDITSMIDERGPTLSRAIHSLADIGEIHYMVGAAGHYERCPGPTICPYDSP